VLLASVSVVQARDSGPLEWAIDDLVELRVSSASRFMQTAREAPSAVEVITREDIRRHGWQTLAQAINSLTGVYTVSDHAYEYAGARGFLIPGDYNTRFLLLIDGQRSNDNIYEQASFGNEFIVDMDLVERIEYIPGPGSAIYGSNAIFGTINVVTRRVGELPPGSFGGNFGSDGWRGARATLARRLESGAGFTLSTSYADRDGRDRRYEDSVGGLLVAGGGNSPDGVAHGLDSLRKRQFFGRWEDGGASIAVRYGDRRVQPSSALYGTLFDDPGLRIEDSLLSALASYEKLVGDFLRVEGRLEYGEVGYDADYPYEDGGGNRYLNRDEACGRWWAGELRGNYVGIEGHHLVAGVELQADRENRQRNFDVGTAVNVPVDVDQSRQRQGLYLLDEWAFSERWLLNVGARYDHFSDIEARASPRVGLIWKAGEATTFKLLAGRAYRTPNAYERDYENGVNYLGNPALRPESIRTVEGIWEQRIGAVQTLRLALFDYHIKDLIAQADAGGGALQYQNQPLIKARGAEIAWVSKSASGIRLAASLSVNETRGTGDLRPGFSPPWVAKLRASHPLPGRLLLALDSYATAATGYDWQGTRQHLPSRALADLVLTTAESREGAGGHLRVRNLFDRRYAHPGSAEAPVPALAADGRELEIAVKYAF
jgi:iron complex outermembrane receptor protein